MKEKEPTTEPTAEPTEVTETTEVVEETAEVEEGTFEHVDKVLSFDPFSEESKAQAAEEQPVETEEKVVSGEAPTEEEPVAASPSTEEAPAETPEMKLLREHNAFLQTQLSAPPAPEPTPEQVKVEEAKDAIPSYQFQLEDALLMAIGSEDQAEMRRGLSFLVSQIGQAVHTNLRKEYRTHTADAIQSYVTRHAEDKTQSETIQSDFYGKFPEYNNDVGRMIVGQAGTAYYAKHNVTGWSPEVRDGIAALAKESLQRMGVQAPPTPAEQNTRRGNGKPRRQAKQVTPTSRPSVKTGNSKSDEIYDTVFGE